MLWILLNRCAARFSGYSGTSGGWLATRRRRTQRDWLLTAERRQPYNSFLEILKYIYVLPIASLGPQWQMSPTQI